MAFKGTGLGDFCKRYNIKQQIVNISYLAIYIWHLFPVIFLILILILVLVLILILILFLIHHPALQVRLCVFLFFSPHYFSYYMYLEACW